MSSELETASEHEAPATDQAGSKKSSPPAASPPPLDEAAINAPSLQTLIMLSVVCVSTLVMWAAGRAACNYEVPGESLTPRKVTLEERSRMPKDVGIEFAQALSGGDFATAAELAQSEGTAFVQAEKSQCGACAGRIATRQNLMSVGTVLQANTVDSIVKVRTLGGADGEVVRFFGIERQERKWLVTRVLKSAEEGKLREAPVRDDAPPGIRRPLDEQGGDPTSEDTMPTEAAAATDTAVKTAPSQPSATPRVPAPAPAPAPVSTP